MSYENATSTIALATHCCACSRPLRDAVSVETGMGPVCREKYGFYVEADDASKATANALIHKAAVEQDASAELLQELCQLGYGKVAQILADNIGPGRVRISLQEACQRYACKTPYSPDSVRAWRAIPGRRWDNATKSNTFPVESKGKVWELLKRFHSGMMLETDNGMVTIP